jgi:hypothetical protein
VWERDHGAVPADPGTARIVPRVLSARAADRERLIITPKENRGRRDASSGAAAGVFCLRAGLAELLVGVATDLGFRRTMWRSRLQSPRLV